MVNYNPFNPSPYITNPLMQNPNFASAPPLTGFQKISQALQGIASLENKPLEHLSKLASAAPQLYSGAYAQALTNQTDPSRDLDRQVKEAQLFKLTNPDLDPSKAVELRIQQLKLQGLSQEQAAATARQRIFSGQSPVGINSAAPPVFNPNSDISILPPSGASDPLNVRNNNPGNLRPVGADNGFQQFESPQAGYEALTKDLTAKISGNSGAMKARYGENYAPTLENIITTWAPPTENDTQGYISNVAEWTGLDPKAPLSVTDIQKLAPAIIRQEGGPEAVAAFNPAMAPEVQGMPLNVSAGSAQETITAPPIDISTAQMMPTVPNVSTSVPFVSNPAIPQYEQIVQQSLDPDGSYAQKLAELKGQEAVRYQSYLNDQNKPAPERKTITQDGINYFADTGEPVLSSIPAKREIIDQEGIKYYSDTGEKVLPNAKSNPKLTDGDKKNNNLAQESLSNLQEVKKFLFNKDGSVKTENIGALDVTYGDGRSLDQALNRAIQNAVYLKTGAAATPSELTALYDQYKPAVRDSDAQIKAKIDSFEQFINSNIAGGPSVDKKASAITVKIPTYNPKTGKLE